MHDAEPERADRMSGFLWLGGGNAERRGGGGGGGRQDKNTNNKKLHETRQLKAKTERKRMKR